jgi:hypothetical protein
MQMADRCAENPSRGDYRYEVKCTAAVEDLPLVQSLIRCHPAGFRQAYPPRRVNNCYFDTPAWGALQENLSGIRDRA